MLFSFYHSSCASIVVKVDYYIESQDCGLFMVNHFSGLEGHTTWCVISLASDFVEDKALLSPRL